MKDPYVISSPQRLLRKGDTYPHSKVLESSGKKHLYELKQSVLPYPTGSRNNTQNNKHNYADYPIFIHLSMGLS